jgi:hypothetical protein
MSLEPHPTRDGLHRRIGRNLVQFQQIEFAVKFSLHYMHPDGSKDGMEAFRTYRERIRTQPLTAQQFGRRQNTARNSTFLFRRTVLESDVVRRHSH